MKILSYNCNKWVDAIPVFFKTRFSVSPQFIYIESGPHCIVRFMNVKLCKWGCEVFFRCHRRHFSISDVICYYLVMLKLFHRWRHLVYSSVKWVRNLYRNDLFFNVFLALKWTTWHLSCLKSLWSWPFVHAMCPGRMLAMLAWKVFAPAFRTVCNSVITVLKSSNFLVYL